ncbi:MAG: PP2C family protein-serine/threonine phosphatase [Spirochaetota bacterium]
MDFLKYAENIFLDSVNTDIKKLIYPMDIKDAHYRVASRIKNASYLGGDIYNQMRDSNGNYWFAIGDASGHDINSHLFSMVLLVQMNYYINIYDSPKQISNSINKDLEAKIVSDKSINLTSYASMAILKADAEGNFIHYGQHPNFIIYRKAEQKAEIISTCGKFIGLEVDKLENDSEDSFQMQSGDIIFLFTDGIFEQKNKQGKYFGYKLYEFIDQLPNFDVEALADELFAKVHEFSNNQVDDDMTLLVIEKV